MNVAVSPFLDTAPESRVRNARPKSKTLPKLIGAAFLAPCSTAAALDIVAKRFRVTRENICGRSRLSHIMRARHVAAWLLRQTGMSLEEVGRELGWRDHTTIGHSVARVESERDGSDEVREMLDAMVKAVVSEGMVLEVEERT